MSNEIKAAESFCEITVANRVVTLQQWADDSNLTVAQLESLGVIVTVPEDSTEYLHLGNELMPLSFDTAHPPISLDVNPVKPEHLEYYRELTLDDLTVKNEAASFDERLGNILAVAVTYKIPYTVVMVKVGTLAALQEPTENFYTDDALDGKKVEDYLTDYVKGSDIPHVEEWLYYSHVIDMLGL